MGRSRPRRLWTLRSPLGLAVDADTSSSETNDVQQLCIRTGASRLAAALLFVLTSKTQKRNIVAASHPTRIGTFLAPPIWRGFFVPGAFKEVANAIPISACARRSQWVRRQPLRGDTPAPISRAITEDWGTV